MSAARRPVLTWPVDQVEARSGILPHDTHRAPALAFLRFYHILPTCICLLGCIQIEIRVNLWNREWTSLSPVLVRASVELRTTNNWYDMISVLFCSQSSAELSFSAGDVLTLISKASDDWWECAVPDEPGSNPLAPLPPRVRKGRVPRPHIEPVRSSATRRPPPRLLSFPSSRPLVPFPMISDGWGALYVLERTWG